MIQIKNTPNLTGVEISGDFNDFENLTDAFYQITAVDSLAYHNISARILALCYDIRHAMQGDREIELLENGINETIMKFHSMIVPKNNVYYKCNCLYPEMFFVMLALNELVKLRMRNLTKSKHAFDLAFEKDAIWDGPIATIRLFQAKFTACFEEIITENAFNRWLKLMNDRYLCFHEIAVQYVDFLNIKYLKMNHEKRLKNLTTIAKRIAEFHSDADHIEIKEVVTDGAREHGCSENELSLEGMEYPEEILW